MLTKVQTSRTRASYWLLSLFAVIILLSAFITEFFQAPTEKTHVLSQYRSLIEDKKLQSTSKLVLKNSIGSFTLERTLSSWNLISPRSLPAKESTVKMILDTLSNINIKKVYQSDPINMANFSLDSPLIQFTLIDHKGKKESFLLGLVNPIDNTTYIQVPEKEIIYQVDALKNSFESLDLSDFIDSTIFSSPLENVQELSIYRGAKASNNVQISFKFQKENWVGKNNRVLDDKKVSEYFEKIFNLRSTLIVDKSSEELKQALDEKLEKPLYTVDVIQKNGSSLSYKVSHIINTLPGLKIEKRQHVLIKASDRTNIFIIHKDRLPLFSQRQSDYRNLNFKKLFY